MSQTGLMSQGFGSTHSNLVSSHRSPASPPRSPDSAMMLHLFSRAITPGRVYRSGFADSHRAHAATTSSASAASGPASGGTSCSTPAEACAVLWGDCAQPLLSLERSLPASVGADSELWGSGRFSAEVYPDLPSAASWHGLLQHGIHRCDRYYIIGYRPALTCSDAQSWATSDAIWNSISCYVPLGTVSRRYFAIAGLSSPRSA